MAQSQRTTELHDTISDIYDLVQAAGPTRADMEGALDSIADLCTEAVPELDTSDDDASDSEDE
jgi:hypothetical protein